MSIRPVMFGTVQTIAARIQNSDGTALVTIYDPPTNGARIDTLCVASTDTSARDVQLWITVSGTDYLIGTITIPARAGDLATVPAKNLLTDLVYSTFVMNDAAGNKIIYLKDGAVLKAGEAVTLTSAKIHYFTGWAMEA